MKGTQYFCIILLPLLADGEQPQGRRMMLGGNNFAVTIQQFDRGAPERPTKDAGVPHDLSGYIKATSKLPFELENFLEDDIIKRIVAKPSLGLPLPFAPEGLSVEQGESVFECQSEWLTANETTFQFAVSPKITLEEFKKSLADRNFAALHSHRVTRILVRNRDATLIIGKSAK